MFTRPADLSDDAVAATLRHGWAIDADEIAYAAVGFGSHHWRATTRTGRWFLTVDNLDTRLRDGSDTRQAAQERLVAALSTARSLRSEGCDFVVSPLLSESGDVVELIDDRYVLAVFTHIDGATGPFGRFDKRTDRFEVVDLLVMIHDAGAHVLAQTDDFSIPSRDHLDQAMKETTELWSAGPFAERARELLQQHDMPLRRALAAYDDRVAWVRSKDAPLVITHGEPHRGNIIFTVDGPVLIDWDTTLLAPPERDLWSLVEEDPEVRAHYERHSRRTLDDKTLQMFGLWWDLCEVALFVHEFRRPHQDTNDTRTAWQALQRHLDPRRWLDIIEPRDPPR